MQSTQSSGKTDDRLDFGDREYTERRLVLPEDAGILGETAGGE